MALKFTGRTDNKKSVTLNFEGDIQTVEKNVGEFFAARKYKLKKGTPDEAVYERGNYVVRILLGAFVPYYKFNVNITAIGNNVELNLSKAHSGFSGGVIGMAKLNKEYKKVADGLEKIDSALGVYNM